MGVTELKRFGTMNRRIQKHLILLVIVILSAMLATQSVSAGGGTRCTGLCEESRFAPPLSTSATTPGQ
jgi:hypothetical protein